MKGYIPNLKLNSKTELSSQKQKSFIELGVKEQECEEGCECEECKGK